MSKFTQGHVTSKKARFHSPHLVPFLPHCIHAGKNGHSDKLPSWRSSRFQKDSPRSYGIHQSTLGHSLDSEIILEKQTSSESLPKSYARKFWGNRTSYISPLTGLTSLKDSGLRNSALLLLNLTQHVGQGAYKCPDNSRPPYILLALAPVVTLLKGPMFQLPAKAAGSS